MEYLSIYFCSTLPFWAFVVYVLYTWNWLLCGCRCVDITLCSDGMLLIWWCKLDITFSGTLVNTHRHYVFFLFFLIQIAAICQEAGMHAVRKNRYVILPKDFEKGYRTNVKKPETDFDFYKWCNECWTGFMIINSIFLASGLKFWIIAHYQNVLCCFSMAICIKNACDEFIVCPCQCSCISSVSSD